jgi:hypothetical protein
MRLSVKLTTGFAHPRGDETVHSAVPPEPVLSVAEGDGMNLAQDVSPGWTHREEPVPASPGRLKAAGEHSAVPAGLVQQVTFTQDSSSWATLSGPGDAGTEPPNPQLLSRFDILFLVRKRTRRHVQCCVQEIWGISRLLRDVGYANPDSQSAPVAAPAFMRGRSASVLSFSSWLAAHFAVRIAKIRQLEMSSEGPSFGQSGRSV